MKSLYSILGVGADASAEEIAASYQRILAMYPETMLPEDERQVQLVASREAYATLSDPVKRNLYDQQRRMASQSPRRGDTASPCSTAIDEVKVSGAISLFKVLVVGIFIVVALAMCSANNREQQRLKLEKEQEVELRRIQLEEERQKLAALEQQARLERQERMEQAAIEERSRREAQQAIRDVDARERQFQRDSEAQQRQEEARRRQEASDRRQQDRDAEYQRQRARQELDQQAARLRALARNR